jgi:CRISPR-associated protein Csy3
MAKQTTINAPSNLSFERKLDPSDALFSSCSWNNRLECEPVPVIEKTVRGVISNIAKATTAKIESANPQTVDVAQLPQNHDTLRVRFTLRVLGGVGVPCVCNSAEYEQRLVSLVRENLQDDIAELSRRYAGNIANARFLWRNRLAAEDIVVHVLQMKGGNVANRWEFQSKNYAVNDYRHDKTFDELAKAIQNGLANGYTLFEVSAYARAGAGQQVFPSEEMIMRKGKDDKSKTLYAVDGQAAMHSQKIGNALRTIDDWYPREQGDFGPVAVEPYGQVTTRGLALRQPKQKVDFYTLLDSWVAGEDIGTDSRRFVVANLIRGGVFGRSGK